MGALYPWKSLIGCDQLAKACKIQRCLDGYVMFRLSCIILVVNAQLSKYMPHNNGINWFYK